MELAPLFGPGKKKEEELKDKLMDKDDDKETSLSDMFEKGVKEAEDTYPSREPKFPRVVKEESSEESMESLEKRREDAWQALKKNPKDVSLKNKYFTIDKKIIACLNKMGEDVVQEKYPEPKDYPSSQGKYPASASESKKVVKEAVPPMRRDIVMQQQEKDMQKLMAQEAELQKRLQQIQAQKDAFNKKLALGPAPEQTPMHQVNQELGRAKFGMMNQESLTISKAQLKEAIKKGVQINERKKFIYETVKAQISEQVETRNLIESLINEGPLSTAFAGIKGAAQGAVQGAKSAFGQARQGFQQASAQQQAKDAQTQALKQAQKAVADAMKNVSSSRNKFSQEILKNAGLINQYHDAVVNLKQAADQAKSSLSQPEAQRIDSESTIALGQLYQDLDSEKRGIDTFLKDLESKIGKDKLLMTRTKAAVNKAQNDPNAGVYGVGGKGPARAGLRGTRGGGGSGLL